MKATIVQLVDRRNGSGGNVKLIITKPPRQLNSIEVQIKLMRMFDNALDLYKR